MEILGGLSMDIEIPWLTVNEHGNFLVVNKCFVNSLCSSFVSISATIPGHAVFIPDEYTLVQHWPLLLIGSRQKINHINNVKGYWSWFLSFWATKCVLVPLCLQEELIYLIKNPSELDFFILFLFLWVRVSVLKMSSMVVYGFFLTDGLLRWWLATNYIFLVLCCLRTPSLLMESEQSYSSAS